MCTTAFTVRYNAMTVSSIASFAGIAGRMHGGCKDVYFLRVIGCNPSYLADIAQMDAQLSAKQARGQGRYLRLGDLPRLSRPEDVAAYSAAVDAWQRDPTQAPPLAVAAQNTALGDTLAQALCQVRDLFRGLAGGVSDSMLRNVMTKLFFWLDGALAPLLEQWQPETLGKFVLTGQVGKHAYLLCELLTLVGIDVLLLSPGGPLALDAALQERSAVLHLGTVGEMDIPPYCAAPPPQEAASSPVPEGPAAGGHKVDVSRPDRARPVVTVPARASLVIPEKVPRHDAVAARQELPFEQLALLASCVVMITVHDHTGQPISGGSGIMVGREGFILTNHHVACRGSAFSVHIEDDPTVYHTSEVIKTHALLDLALIRIARTLRPIPVYQGAAPLVRGQKVVAIGSPLGLFNSVSDGIISGFRTIDEVDMIQFTAPTSPGSSGGAVLNLYGEVIGISTAGIDRGQNLNLAVGHQSILPFIRGFTT